MAGLLVLLGLPRPLWGADPERSFDQASRYELDGHAYLAFLSYQKAAEAGLPNAEFNVAAMLDSGRGTNLDVAKAATWYARAASHGHRRAAYNLGLLYEIGQGVPKNSGLARAWFAASRLPAGRARLSTSQNLLSKGALALQAPEPVAPTQDPKTVAGIDGVEFVWTARLQPEPVRYYVEIQELNASASRNVFSAFSLKSSLFVAALEMEGSYQWRVSTVSSKTSQRVASRWLPFNVVQGPRSFHAN